MVTNLSVLKLGIDAITLPLFRKYYKFYHIKILPWKKLTNPDTQISQMITIKQSHRSFFPQKIHHIIKNHSKSHVVLIETLFQNPHPHVMNHQFSFDEQAILKRHMLQKITNETNVFTTSHHHSHISILKDHCILPHKCVNPI